MHSFAQLSSIPSRTLGLYMELLSKIRNQSPVFFSWRVCSTYPFAIVKRLSIISISDNSINVLPRIPLKTLAKSKSFLIEKPPFYPSKVSLCVSSIILGQSSICLHTAARFRLLENILMTSSATHRQFKSIIFHTPITY